MGFFQDHRHSEIYTTCISVFIDLKSYHSILQPCKSLKLAYQKQSKCKFERFRIQMGYKGVNGVRQCCLLLLLHLEGV